MIRSSLAASLAVGALAAGIVEPLFANGPHRGEPGLLPPNAVGTWRLDSLLDQARISGMTPSDVDPSTFVLHDLRFGEGDGGIKAISLPMGLGSGSVEVVDGCVRLKATGKGAAFRIPIPREDSGEFTRELQYGMIALHLRSKEAGEVVLLRDAAGFGGGMGGFGSGFGGGPPPIGITGRPVNVAPPPAGPPGAGGPPPGGMRFGPGGLGGGFPDFDIRERLGSNIAKFATDGEWHAVARTRAQLSPGGGMGMMMGGGEPDPSRTLEEITLLVLPPKDKEKEGASVDLDFVHVLDAKAEYASKAAAACSIAREGVTHCGLYLNTPCEAAYRLVAPANGRLLAGLTAIDDRPFELFVHVTANGSRKTVLAQKHESARTIDSIDVDLAAYAGQEIELTLEAVEADQPTVAFLLQPLVYGKRKDGVKNVFLYFSDTTRADALSCYGNPRPTTPNLDAIAADGIRFERCFSQGAWTYVSMPASLSGLYPSVNGVKNGGERIADSVTTMAEAFRNAGYLTAAFIRNDFVGPTTNTHQGFDFFFPGPTIVSTGDSSAETASKAALQQVVARMLGRGGNGGGANDAAMLGNTNIFASGSGRDLCAKAEPWVEKYSDVPFVLYLHAVEPHDPYDDGKESDWGHFLSKEEIATFRAERTAFQNSMGQGPGVIPNLAVAPRAVSILAMAPRGGATGSVANGSNPTAGGSTTPPAGPNVTPPAPLPPPKNQREAISRALLNPKDPNSRLDPDAYIAREHGIYDGEVVYFDRHLQRMVDLMKAKGLWNELVFSFNADHGEEFLDHDNTGHGQSVYAELNHVPWLLHAPGLPRGKVLTDSVMNLDVAPTLLGLCGIAPPPEFQGRNLAEVLASGDDVPPQPIFTERWGGGLRMFSGSGDGDSFDGNLEFMGQWAVIEGRWKTIVTRSAQPQLDADGKQLKGTDGKPLPPTLKVELEIYDLDHDLKDANSLLADERPRAEAAAKRLETWLIEMKKLNGRYADENTSSEGAAAALKALGYAQ